MSAPHWFVERAAANPAPRWLGLVPRPLRLIEGTACRLPVPVPPLGQAGSARPSRPAAPPAHTIGALGLREDRRLGGTVNLEGLSAYDLPLAEAPPRQDGWHDLGTGQRAGDRERGPEPYSAEQGLARLLAGVLQPPLDLLLDREGPLTWPHPLLKYQIDGIRALIERPSLLLADDMGLGKTVQAIAALRILVRQRRLVSALAVAPAGLLAQWRAELERWAPELRVVTVHGEPRERSWLWRAPAHLYLTSYETLRMDFTANPRSPVARLWYLVILDEAQRIKNADTDISHACKRLRRQRQWALTGTPLENSIEDLRSLLQFVDPQPPGASWHLVSHSELRQQLQRVQLRRRKADVLADLPPKLVTSIPVPLSAAQRASYDRAEQEGIVELRALGAAVKVQNVLELITRLKQICNRDPASGRSSKLDDLRERIRTLADEGHKALVFTQFANRESGARAIAAGLDVPALVYVGDQPQATRNAIIERFRQEEDQKVLILALRAGGQGLNLQQASYVFHFDRWWNPAVEQQAEARSHRMGQRYPVHVYTYTCEHTIEERIERVLADKQLLFDELVDGVSIDPAAHLTGEELFGLFGLPAPESGDGGDRAASRTPTTRSTGIPVAYIEGT